MNKSWALIIISLCLLLTWTGCSKVIELRTQELFVVLGSDEPDPLKLAVSSLCDDFEKVTGAKPRVVSSLEEIGDGYSLVIVNRESHSLGLDESKIGRAHV